MKLLLTADLQFDDYANYSTQHESGVTSRLNDMILCWEWMTSVASERGCDAIVAVGDIFDSRTVIDVSVLDRVCRAVANTRGQGIDVHFVAGNHDSYLRVPTINSLQVFRGLATIWDKPGVLDCLGFLPWSEDLDLFKQQPEILHDQGAEYLFAHVLVKGAVHSAAGGLPVEDLRPDLFKRVLLGDVHEPVDVAKNAHYIASPMQLDYGDAGGMRGVRVLDTTKNRLEFVENTVSPRFHILSEFSKRTEIRRGDFVRVKTDDAKVAEKLATEAKAKTGWVETTFVEVPETLQRADIRTNLEASESLRRYCEFKGVDDPELLAMGLELLTKARG